MFHIYTKHLEFPLCHFYDLTANTGNPGCRNAVIHSSSLFADEVMSPHLEQSQQKNKLWGVYQFTLCECLLTHFTYSGVDVCT